MATAFITHPSCMAHETPADHPEHPRRLGAIFDQLHADGIYDLLAHYQAPMATRAQLERVHTARLINSLERLSPSAGVAPIDADTVMGVHTLEAARHSAGAAVLATTLVMEGEADNAFCAIRPPGHHATRDRAMGFCLFNNVAVGVAHALAAYDLERVVVLDFDVHHGNGTEDIFDDDERVLVCSAFQYPFYPFGGEDTTRANTVDVPLPAGTDSEQYRAAIVRCWLPAVTGFAPRMVFVSAGFDGHIEDQQAHFQLVDDDYRWLTDLILRIAHRHAGGRIVSCLEGGYALAALGRCVSTHLRGLAGL